MEEKGKVMGKEMRKLHKIVKLAMEIIENEKISWNAAIEKAKLEVEKDEK